MVLNERQQNQLSLIQAFLESDLAKQVTTEANENRVVDVLKDSPPSGKTPDIFDEIVNYLTLFETQQIAMNSQIVDLEQNQRAILKVLKEMHETRLQYDVECELNSACQRFGIY